MILARQRYRRQDAFTVAIDDVDDTNTGRCQLT